MFIILTIYYLNNLLLLYRKQWLHESQRLTFWLSFVRSSRLQIFFKVGLIKNFVNFTGKHLCWSLLLRKFKTDSNTDVFPRNFVNFLKYLFTEHLRWLILEGFCEGVSLVKVLQFCHFNIFGINNRCLRKMPIKKNYESLWLLKHLLFLLLLLKVPPLQNNNFSKCVIWGTSSFFYFVEKLCSALKIFKFLYF